MPLEVGQVETGAEFDDGADDEWFRDLRPPAERRFTGELHAPLRIRFPEVDPGTQPIVIVVAHLKRFTAKQSFSDGAVAAVVAENKAGREPVQSRLVAVVLGELTGFGVNAFFD